MTNFEKIKIMIVNMSIDEMAHFFAKIDADCTRLERSFLAYRAERVADNYEWLKQEESDEQ